MGEKLHAKRKCKCQMIVLYKQVENASQTQALRVALAEIRGHDRTETSKKHAFPHHKKLNGDSI